MLNITRLRGSWGLIGKPINDDKHKVKEIFVDLSKIENTNLNEIEDDIISYLKYRENRIIKSKNVVIDRE